MNNKLVLALIAGLLVVGGIVFVATGNKNTPKVDTVMKKEETATKASSRYLIYSKEAFDKAEDKKRVLYFHASWCPICKPIDKEFSENAEKIPEDVILFKTDYDKEEALKTKYGVSYQHTFVQVDNQGNDVTSWSGGGIVQLASKVK